MIDIKQALLNPASVFKTPDEVVNSPEISHEQKIKILRRWEYDAREMEVAEEENMGGGGPDILDLILKALLKLGVTAREGNSAPNKQGGE